jgi:hypothetical protein
MADLVDSSSSGGTSARKKLSRSNTTNSKSNKGIVVNRISEKRAHVAEDLPCMLFQSAFYV